MNIDKIRERAVFHKADFSNRGFETAWWEKVNIKPQKQHNIFSMLLEYFACILKRFSVVGGLTFQVPSTPTQNFIIRNNRCDTKIIN